MENPKPESHGETTANNNNQAKTQNNPKELLRRIEDNTHKDTKTGVNIWLLKCQISKQTFSLTGALDVETLAYW